MALIYIVMNLILFSKFLSFFKSLFNNNSRFTTIVDNLEDYNLILINLESTNLSFC